MKTLVTSHPDYTRLYLVYWAVRKIINKGELGLVGGCVRDTLLGVKPKDYDFNTNLTPDEIEELAKAAGRHVYTIGKKYGTIGFKVLVEDMPAMVSTEVRFPAQEEMLYEKTSEWVYVEVTTYRDEKYDANSRKPVVTFGTDLRQDLLRRDFTINAMWYGSLTPDNEPELKDLMAGRLDLLDRRIKSCRDAKKMIEDDPLRILRAVRFATKYEFSIEPNLYGSCAKSKPKLWKVAVERITEEYDKILCCNHAEIGIRLLNDMGITEMLFPELTPTPFRLIRSREPNKAWMYYLSYIGGHTREADGAWIFDKPRHDYLCRGIAARMKFSNKRLETIIKERKWQ